MLQQYKKQTYQIFLYCVFWHRAAVPLCLVDKITVQPILLGNSQGSVIILAPHLHMLQEWLVVAPWLPHLSGTVLLRGDWTQTGEVILRGQHSRGYNGWKQHRSGHIKSIKPVNLIGIRLVPQLPTMLHNNNMVSHLVLFTGGRNRSLSVMKYKTCKQSPSSCVNH